MNIYTNPSPKVSVVIPAYNYAHYLVFSLESVLAQEFKDFEVIIVDDGSTDNTRELVASYGDPRIRYIFQQNKGMAETRNTGIRSARGNLVALLDADDRWLPHKLTKQVNLFEQFPYLGLVFGEAETIDEKGTVKSVINIPGNLPFPTIYENLLGKGIIPGSASSVLIPKSCFDEVGLFDHACGGLADLDMWRRIARKFDCRGVPEILTQIRVHQASVTHAKRAYMAEGMIACILRVIREVGQEERYQAALKFAQQRMYTHACMYFLEDAIHDYRGNAEESEISNSSKALAAWINIPDRPIGLTNLPQWHGEIVENMSGFFMAENNDSKLVFDGAEVIFRALKREGYIDLKEEKKYKRRGRSLVLMYLAMRAQTSAPWYARGYAVQALFFEPKLLIRRKWAKVFLGEKIINEITRFKNR